MLPSAVSVSPLQNMLRLERSTEMGSSAMLLTFWLFSVFWLPLIHVGHWVTRKFFFVMSFYRGFTYLPSGSRSKFHTHTHTHLILFQHICLWVMISFHNLSLFLWAWNSSVVVAVIQSKPTKCTFPKLIFYKLYQIPRPQYLTHSSTY